MTFLGFFKCYGTKSNRFAAIFRMSLKDSTLYLMLTFNRIYRVGKARLGSSSSESSVNAFYPRCTRSFVFIRTQRVLSVSDILLLANTKVRRCWNNYDESFVHIERAP